ncbi:MAG: DUF3794 domain-containing protein [Clostridia bacterium]
MEGIYKNVRFSAPSKCAFSQAAIEADIPVIDGHVVDRILLSTGRADIIKHNVTDSGIEIEGKIAFNIVAIDGKEVFSFNSTAQFSHSIDMEGVSKDVKASVKADLSLFEITSAGDTLALKCVIDIAVRASSYSSVDMLTGVKSCEVELKQLTLKQKKRVLIEKRSITIHDEVVMSDLKAILLSEGNLNISMAVNNSGTVTVSGIINISALIKKLDSSLSRLTQSLPFSTEVEISANCEIYTDLITDCVKLRPMGGEFGLISVEAIGTLFIYAQEDDELKLTLDAYSIFEPFSVKCIGIKSCYLASSINENVTIRENINLPDGMNDIYGIVYSSLRPVVTACSEDEQHLTVHGIAFLTCLYTDENGGLNTYSDEFPFTVATNEPYNQDSDISASLCRVILTGAMKNIEVKYTLNISGEIFKEESILVVSGVDPCDPPEKKHGVSMYFLSPGEDAFYVGKRFNVKRNDVLVCDEGNRAIVIR